MFDQLLKTGFTVTPTADGGYDVRPLGVGAVKAAVSADETALRKRWAKSGAKATKQDALAFVDELQAQGLTLTPAKGHNGTESKQTYMHLEALSKSNNKVSAYINTGVVRVHDAWGMGVVKSLPGAVPRPSGSAVAFHLTDVDQCRAAVKALLEA